MNFFLCDDNRFLNIAHRGGAGLRPENTVLAFRHGLSVGADAIEGDLHATRDGVVVFSHDAVINRCTEGQGKIKDMTFKALRSFDAGYRFTRDNGATYPYRGKGLTIPSLEEVLNDSILAGAPMVLEIKQEKPTIIDEVLNLVETCGLEDRMIVGSFIKPVQDEIREKACRRGMNIVTSLAEEEVLAYCMTPLEEMSPDGGYIAPGKILQVPLDYEIDGRNIQVVDNIFMTKANSQGLKVQIWTVNESDQMHWLIRQMKVDGILTDHPDLLARIYHESLSLP